jgi:predicted nucleotidyltransferase
MDIDRATLHAAIEGAVSGHPEIAAAYLYGSAVRGTATPLSDVDLGLLFREPEGSFRDRLATAVGIGSAIARDLSGVRVDARDLDELPLAIVGAVLTDGELVVSNDEERRVAFERDTRLRYFDFLPIHLGEVKEANASLRRRFLRG